MTDSSELINEDIFSEMKQMLEDDFVEICKMYKGDTKTYISDLKTAVDNENLDDTILSSHTIKSSSRQLGLSYISELAAKIELTCKKAAQNNDDVNWIDMKPIIQHIESDYEKIITVFKERELVE